MKIKTAITLGAMALGALSGSAYAAPVTPPGEEAGLNAAPPLPEGVYFVNIFGTGGNYLVDDKRSNLTFDVPAMVWATPWQLNLFGLTGRIEVIGAAPVIANLGLINRACEAADTCKDITAMYNPLLLVGSAWDLGGGWSLSSFNGGYAPVDNQLGPANNIWVYNNRSWLSWSGNLTPGGMKDGSSPIKGTIAIENVYGLTGNNVQTGVRELPDYDNVNLGAYVTFPNKWSVGLAAFWSTDLEDFAYGPGQCGFSGGRAVLRCAQSRAAIGPLLQYDFTGISVQAQYTFDVYDNNYRNLDGSTMQINQFWLKTVIPLWNPPALEPAPVTYKN
jgi:hypothetical protein